MKSVPVSNLDYELVKLAFVSRQEVEQKLLAAHGVVQQQLNRMAKMAGVDLSVYTFNLDTKMFEPIPQADNSKPEPPEGSNLVPFPAT